MTEKNIRIPIRFRTKQQIENYSFLVNYLEFVGEFESFNTRVNKLIDKEVKRLKKVKK